MVIFSYLFTFCISVFSKRSLYTLLAIFLSGVTSVAYSQEFAPDKPSDVRIIVDISGSMKKNDPENLRLPAVDMLTKLLPDGSKAGVWTFGQFINMLVKHREVDEAWKKSATAKSSGISSVGQYTNIGEALEKAAYDKNYSTKGQYQTHIILLTDGMVDIDRNPDVNDRERNRIINEILPEYQKAEFIIHTVSLSNKADKKLMDKLALSTGGQSAIANSADELMKIFLQIFNRAVPQEELPFEGNSFLTDSSIEEFTALIFREPNSPETTLFAPDKSEYTKDTQDKNVSWFRTDTYDLITVKQPLEGEWRVLADLEPQSRITVVSDLSLSVKSIASNLMVNDIVDLSLAFREENKIVDRAEFLDLLDINVTVNELGQSTSKDTWSKELSDGLVPGDGIYKAVLNQFKAVGEYEIIVDVDGKTFQRRSVQRVNVRTPFKVETQTNSKGGNTQFIIEVIPQSQSVDIAGTKVVAKLKPPAGSSLIKPFELTEDQLWRLSIDPKDEGVYRATIRITTRNASGELSDIIPEPIEFAFPVLDDIFKETTIEEPEPTVEIEKIEPAKEEPIEAISTEEAPEAPATKPEESDTPEDSNNMMQWILYGVIGLVNLVIIGVIFFLYRKFVKPKKEEPEVDSDTDNEAPEPSEAMSELPMDEMVIDELDELEDDIDLAEQDSVEQAVSADDGLADLTPESLDDNIEDDDILSEDVLDDEPTEEVLSEIEEAAENVVEDTAGPNEGVLDSLDMDLETESVDEVELETPPQENADDSESVDEADEISNDFTTELLEDDEDTKDDDALNDMLNLEDDDTASESPMDGIIDEEPEFDLDDFAPDQLDAQDSEKKE